MKRRLRSTQNNAKNAVHHHHHDQVQVNPSREHRPDVAAQCIKTGEQVNIAALFIGRKEEEMRGKGVKGAGRQGTRKR